MKRRDARLELIEFLLNANSKAQAQAELIALAENLGEDPSQQERVGDLFLQAQDYEHALAAYRLRLKEERDKRALAGAGFAALPTGPLSAGRALPASGGGREPERHAECRATQDGTTGFEDGPVPAADFGCRSATKPWWRRSKPQERDCAHAEHREGRRLPTAAQSSLATSWARMQTRISEAELTRDPDLVEAAMDLVFEIERQTNATSVDLLPVRIWRCF